MTTCEDVSVTDRADAQPYDALLLVSFGGPEGPDDVMPFLENVTRGRGIPRERLLGVAEHYHHFGGASPINDQCRALIAALTDDFARAGLDLPVYWGNRNWHPHLADTLARMTRDGVGRALVLVTAAYASYSGCRQYRENLADALASPEVARAAEESGNEPPRLDKLRHYFNDPGFAEPMARVTLAALDGLPPAARTAVNPAPLLFVTHSVPVTYDETAGPDGGAYGAQHRDLAAWIAARVTEATGVEHPWELVFCSRSGPPQQAWLEPDVSDGLAKAAAGGAAGAVVIPIGFVSDHMEVAYDLDVEAARTAAEHGLAFARAATVGDDAGFAAGVRELVLERAARERGGAAAGVVPRPTIGRLGPSHDLCPAGCCPNPRGPRPAACGVN
jgi:ferrochelatase